MATYHQPGNDTARVVALNSALGAAKSDRQQGKEYVLDETFHKLKSFSKEFEDRVTTISHKLSDRSKEIEERNSSLDLLSTFIRDGYEVARRQVNRLNLPAHVLTMYGLPLDGSNPNPATGSEWITIGKTFVEGAKKVEAEGLPAVSCPSATEIEQKLKKAEKEYTDVVSADRTYDDEQANIADMRKQADELISDVMSELRLTLRKLDMPSQRRIMRSYGAQFKYLQGEEVDPEDEAPIIDEGTGVQAS